jgi:MoxR-like ATPase
MAHVKIFLFGSFSLKSLKEDRHERILDGKLPEASIAFLDEIFKANSSILNSLLTLINERKFYNGGSAVDCPLETMVGASNELPESKELDALYDRFLLRYWVGYIQDMGKFKDLLMSSPPSVTTSITLDELHEMQEGACNVDISEKTIDLIIQLKLSLEREGFTSSDRRWKKALDIIAAHAYLNGRVEAIEDDLLVLQHVLWDDPKDKSTLSWLISKICTPAIYAAQEILASVKEAYLKINFLREVPDSEVSGALNEAIQLNSQIKKAITKIKRVANGNMNNVQDSMDELVDMQEKVSKYAMKLSGL